MILQEDLVNLGNLLLSKSLVPFIEIVFLCTFFLCSTIDYRFWCTSFSMSWTCLMQFFYCMGHGHPIHWALYRRLLYLNIWVLNLRPWVTGSWQQKLAPCTSQYFAIMIFPFHFFSALRSSFVVRFSNVCLNGATFKFWFFKS